MNKFSVLLTLTLLLSVLMYSFVTPETNSETELTSWQALEDTYGENIEVEGDLSLLQKDQIHFTRLQNPCAGVGEPCGAALAKARVEAQALANSCCCVITWGVECCDPQQGALKAILFLVQPRNQCN